MSGKVRQLLCGLVSEKGLYPGMELRVEEKVVGRVTSAVFSARTTSNIGLAMIKRGYNDIGTSLLASNGKAQTNVRVVVLPVKSGSADPSGDAEGRGEAGLLA